MAASDSLRLQVVLEALDKATAPLRRIRAASGDAARSLKESRDKLKELNAQQKAIGQFRELQAGLKAGAEKLGSMRARLDELRTAHAADANAAKAHADELKAGERIASKLAAAHAKQLAQLGPLRQRLASLGIKNVAADEARLQTAIASTTAEVDKQTAALKRQATEQWRLRRLREAHGKTMMHVGMMAGSGAAGVATGRALARPIVSSVQAFSQQEDAAMQLRASMMAADGSVPDELRQISDLARQLGDRLPGTTADFYEMMTVLRKEGMSAKAIIGGLGEASAYLGVQLRMPVTEAASFAAKMQDATRATEGEMMALMDVIQRTFYLGVDSSQMLAGFSKMSGVLGKIRETGVDAAKSLAPLLVMMNQTGMEDGASAGNAIRKVVDAGLDAKKLDKANRLLAGNKSGIKLNFVDDKGKYAGLENLFAQLEKLKSIESDMTRTSVMKALFGDDAETHQVLGTLMDKGIAGYREVEAKMKAQADLRQRVNKQLGTMGNVIEAAEGVFTNVLAGVGESVEPELKQLIGWLGEVGEKVGAWVKENPGLVAGMVKVLAVVAALYAGIGGLMVVIAGALGPMFIARFLLARMGLAVGPLASLLKGPLVSGLLSAGRAILFVGRALLMTPLGLLITAIAVLAFLIYKNWGPIKQFFVDLWDSVSAKVSSVWQAITETLGAAWQKVSSGAQSLWNDIKTAFDFGIAWLAALPGRFLTLGADIIQGLANGITGALGAVKTAITGAGEAAIGWFKEKLGIKSPSRVFMLAGREISNGAAEGISERQSRVRQAALGMAAAAAVALPMAAGAAGAGTEAGALQIDRRPPLGAAATQRPVSIGGDTIHITIQAAPGMDAQALARAVSAELDRRQRSNRATMLSSLSDID